MSGIFYIMGKSATGKDKVYRQIKEDYPQLEPIVLYTTRPMRERESEGEEYHFIDEAALEAFKEQGKIIEQRTYQTVHGPWHYATIDDGNVDVKTPGRFYVAIGTLEAYVQTKNYFGENALIPVYLYSSDETRLLRSIRREKKQANPNFKEVCRRFLADEKDFSEEKLTEAGVGPDGRFDKEEIEVCYPKIREKIDRVLREEEA